MSTAWTKSRTFCLTGRSGAGKTSAVTRLAAVLAERRRGVCGVVSHSIYDRNNTRTGLTAVLLPDHPRIPLAEAGPAPDAPSTPTIGLGPWRFSLEAIERVNAHLREECAAAGPDRLTIIDEIGPLELTRRHGFLPGLRAASAAPGDLLVVVRPSLVNAAAEYIRAQSEGIRTAERVFITDPGGVARAVDHLLDMLGA
jgi:nucleoside-triphosphatase THEP1